MKRLLVICGGIVLLCINVFAARLPVNTIGVSVRNVSSVEPFRFINGVPCNYVNPIVLICAELRNLYCNLYGNKQDDMIVPQVVGESLHQQLWQAKSPFLFLPRRPYPRGEMRLEVCNDLAQLQLRLNQCRLQCEKQRQDEAQPPFEMDL